MLWRDCRLGAVEAYGSSWHGVGIEGGRWDYVNLRGSRVERVRVDGCHLGELDLSEAAVRELARPTARILGISVDGDEDRPPAD